MLKEMEYKIRERLFLKEKVMLKEKKIMLYDRDNNKEKINYVE